MEFEQQVLNTLLEQKLQLLNTIAVVGMTWWVSSIVFCGSALGVIWLKRHEIASAPFFGLLGIFLGVFFASIVLFGIWMVVATGILQSETLAVLNDLNIKNQKHIGFLAVQIGYAIGTTSFIIVTVSWVVMWRTISNEHNELSKHKKL